MMMLAALVMAGSVPFDAAARAGLPQGSATLAAHGEQTQCEGVWLGDLLARAGVPTGDAVRGPALATMVVAEAADGYRVVFSLGEITLGKTSVLVADRCDGKPLTDADGPMRLVVPGDTRGARSVRQLRSLSTQVVEP